MNVSYHIWFDMCCPDQSDTSFIICHSGEESGGGTASRPININCQRSAEGKLLSLMLRETWEICTDGCLCSLHLSVINPERVFYSRLMLSVHKPRQLVLLPCSFRTDGKASYIKMLVKLCSGVIYHILQNDTQYTTTLVLYNTIYLKG